MWKYQGPGTLRSILNKFDKFLIMFVLLVIYRQVQFLMLQSIFSKHPKIQSFLNFLQFVLAEGIRETTQTYVSSMSVVCQYVEAADTFLLYCPV